MPNPLAVVLLSGGLDSATTAAIAQAEGFSVAALGIRYGQRHDVELRSAGRVADALGITRRLVLDVDLRAIGGSSLTTDVPVPRDRPIEEMGADIPSTYVPARNTIFLSYALAWAEVLGVRDVFVGVNAVDYSGYPDCRPEYINAFETMANLATKMTTEEGSGFRVQGSVGDQGTAPQLNPEPRTLNPPVNPRFKIHAPLIHLTKAQIIRRGVGLGVDYGLTHSCYDPDSQGRACGRCDSCILRKKGFAEAGVPDPTRYV